MLNITLLAESNTLRDCVRHLISSNPFNFLTLSVISAYMVVVEFVLIEAGTYVDRIRVVVEITKDVVFLQMMLVTCMINSVDVATQVGIACQDVYQIQVANK